MTTFLAFLGIFIPLVMIHELGHFLTAKLAGVKVLEFGLGMPPRIWGFRRGETLYSINAIPLGGFVKMLGEEDSSDPRSLAAKPAAVRAVVMSAGAMMNAILALVLFAAVLMVPRTVQAGDVTVAEVAPASPAAAAGIQPADIIRELNGTRIDSLNELNRQIQLRLGAQTTTVVERDGQRITTQVEPRWRPPAGQGATGVRVALNNAHDVRRSKSFWAAVPGAFSEARDTLTLMKNGIESWFVGGRSPGDDALGPVGIARVTGQVADLGFVALMSFAALLSLNLAIFNILPFPALDGGRLFFLVIEVVRRGKRVSPQKEALVHLTGFAILLALAVVITFNDISRITRGQSPFGG